MRYAYFLPLALLVGCASTDRPVTETPTSVVVTPVPRAFDVPALLGLNAQQIEQPLTTGSVQVQPDRTPRESSTGETESRYTYWHDTTALIVSYNPSTLHVNSFFVKTKSGLTSDYTTLLRLVGVSKFDNRLSIEPVLSDSRPQQYAGVKIVPK